jgi:uncharacterized protein
VIEVPDEIELTAPQARVLGALLEKQATTPDAYPMTLRALTTACNQSTNRDPVVDYDPQLVETTLLALKGKGLARVVHPGSGERVTKYRQVIDEALHLDSDDRAVLCVLLLRGAQTAAELKARTERLHPFSSPTEVEATLERLAGRERELVRQLDRQPGQKERRWIQLLEADAEGRAAAAAEASGRGGSAGGGGRGAGRVEELGARVALLEARLSALVEALDGLVELPDLDPVADRGSDFGSDHEETAP